VSWASHRKNDQAGAGGESYAGPVSVTARAIWFIEGHLNEELSLERVEEAAGVSRFHLSRAFSATVGSSIAAYIRSRRLTEASRKLAEGAPDILTVALDAGYGSHEAFTRAFRQQFGQTPEKVRDAGALHELTLQEAFVVNQPLTAPLAEPRIVQRGRIRIVGLTEVHAQSNAGIPSQWSRFVPYIGHIPNQVGADAYGVVAFPADGPGCEYTAGVEVSAFSAPTDGLSHVELAGATYAVFIYEGHLSGISAAWRSIWDQGLRASGYRAQPAPAFERYGPGFDARTGAGVIEIWVPVEPLPS
jgi:AraC family transcriptional regulator